MQNWVLSGSDLTYKAEFLVEGVPIVPDAGSVYLTIRDNAGSAIAPYIDQAKTVTSTQLELTIPGLVNSPATPGVLEARYVILKYLYEGRPYNQQRSYRLTPFLTFSVTEGDVRKHLGMLPEELEDQEVDLYQAYYELQTWVPSLSTLLQAGTVTSLRANDAIAIMAAILLATSLVARYAQRTVSADSELTRATKFDPKELVAELEAKLDDLINQLTASDPTLVTNPTRFLVGTRTDPITGA